MLKSLTKVYLTLVLVTHFSILLHFVKNIGQDLLNWFLIDFCLRFKITDEIHFFNFYFILLFVTFDTVRLASMSWNITYLDSTLSWVPEHNVLKQNALNMSQNIRDSELSLLFLSSLPFQNHTVPIAPFHGLMLHSPLFQFPKVCTKLLDPKDGIDISQNTRTDA